MEVFKVPQIIYKVIDPSMHMEFPTQKNMSLKLQEIRFLTIVSTIAQMHLLNYFLNVCDICIFQDDIIKHLLIHKV